MSSPAAKPRGRSRAPAPLPAIVGDLSKLSRAGDDPQVAATDRQTAAIEALTAKIDEAAKAFQPAADAVHGLASAQTRFCAWMKGKWPWLLAGGLMILNRTINAAPGDVPHLVEAVTALAKAFGAAG